MPSPITPEMRAALAEVVDYAECGLLAWHDIGEFVENRLPILRALLDALPSVKESLTADPYSTTLVCVVGGELQIAGEPLALGKVLTFPHVPAADHSEDARAMVGVDERAEFEAWAGPRELPMLIADPVPPDYDSFGNYLDPRAQAAWHAWQECGRRATAKDGQDAVRYRTVRELYWFAQQICAPFIVAVGRSILWPSDHA